MDSWAARRCVPFDSHAVELRRRQKLARAEDLDSDDPPLPIDIYADVAVDLDVVREGDVPNANVDGIRFRVVFDPHRPAPLRGGRGLTTTEMMAIRDRSSWYVTRRNRRRPIWVQRFRLPLLVG